MINLFAGYKTQIRVLEKKLKDMDTTKLDPVKVKQITDALKDIKEIVREKEEKREQRKKQKEEVSKEAISVPNAAEVGAVAPNQTTPQTPGAPEATPTTPDDQKVNCPLCGGLTFNDNAALQQHMEFTHASDIAPTTPGQKLDKTVAAVDPNTVKKVETDPKLAPGIIVPDSVKRHDEIVDRVEKDPKIAPHIISEKEEGPQFKLDDVVKPIRGSESTGKVMRWDGKPSDLVYVAWDSGPLAERDTFGGYYPKDLELFKEEPEQVEATMPQAEPICKNCESNKQIESDLKGNYEALLKDLKEERDAHYAQGNHSWTARLDQKILDLEKAIAEKFGNTEKTATGGPELIRQINKATSGHGYDSTVYNLTNGRFQQNVPLKINETTVRMRQPENGTFEVKYPGMDWRPVVQQEFDQWLADWKQINQKNNQKEGGAQNATELTIMDHLPPRANKTKDEGGKDGEDEFQDLWAGPAGTEKESMMPVTSAQKISVFNKELTATPLTTNKAFGGYDISQDGKKLFNIKAKNNQPMNKKQLEFCAQVELTRGMKQAKLTEKVAFLEAGSRVYIMAEDKANRRMKFASLEEGLRGWIPASKIKLIALESQPIDHNGHSDKVLGQTATQTLIDCVEAGPTWVSSTELIEGNRPPATPESLNDLESSKQIDDCTNCMHPWKSHDDVNEHCKECGKSCAYAPMETEAAEYKLSPQDVCDQCEEALAIPGKGKCADCLREFNRVHTEAAKECADCHGHFEGKEGETCPTCGRFAVQKIARPSMLTPGTRIRISDGSGISSGTEGVITTRWEFNSNVQTNERGVPNVGGAYKSVDWSREVPIKLDDGSYMTMFKNRVIPVEQKTALVTALPPTIQNQRGYLNNPSVNAIPETCDQCGSVATVNGMLVHQVGCPERDETLDQTMGRNSSLNKQAHIRHENGKWIVYNHDYKKKLGTYDSKQEAVKRLRQIEYFKDASLRPFSKKAEVMADPYANLTTHITEMRGRMDAVQERIQTMPTVKTAEEGVPEMDLPALFADLTQGINLLETKLGGEEIEPELHASVEELENLLWSLEEELGLTPDISEEEAAEPEHKEIVEDLEKKAASKSNEFKQAVEWLEGFIGADIEERKRYGKVDLVEAVEEAYADSVGMWPFRSDDDQFWGDAAEVACKYLNVPCPGVSNKHADQVTDETITTNDPNAIPAATTTTIAPTIQNVQPTDQDNLEVPVAKPTSPPPPGQQWVYNSDPAVMAYVLMPDATNPGKTI